jgi:hypothetical protein
MPSSRPFRLSLSDEGAIAGAIGATVVAIWFLLLDTLAGIPLRTPSVLGQIVLFGRSRPVTDRVLFDAMIVYTAFHFAVFVLFGIGLVALVRWSIRQSVVRYALLQVFLVFEVFFYGVLWMFSARTSELFPLWTVLGANTLAAIAMGLYLWRLHPDLRESLRETPLGAAPTR